MLETKSVTVAPDKENDTIRLWTSFGWELKSSQEINNTDSHLERRGDQIVNVTTKENYVKLVFSRDKNMPNYDRICQLESKYCSLLDSEPKRPSALNAAAALALLFLFVVPGVLYIVYKVKQFKKFNEQYGPWVQRMETEGKKMLDEVASLL